MQKTAYLALIIGSILMLSWSANPPQGNSGGPFDRTCARSGCHSSSGSITGNVALTGIPDEVDPGETYPFSIRLSVTSGNAGRGGFQLVAVDNDGNDSGVISDAGSSSTTSSFQGRTYFEHQPAKNFGGSNSVEYSANWTAPQGASGSETTFYISAMLVNGNGSPSGDTYVSAQPSFVLAADMNALNAVISDQSDVSCNGETDGSATVTASGGTENYSYAWDNGEQSATANMLSPGMHTVTVSDGVANTSLSVTIEEPATLTTDIEVISSLECGDGQDGSLKVNVAGGTPPYSYVWSNNDITSQINNLAPGQYDVTVSDANSCTSVANISLFAIDDTPPAISAVASIEVKLTQNSSVQTISDLNGILLSSSDNCTTDLDVDWSPQSFGCDDVGTSVLTITARDQSGNETIATVDVEVVDEVAPSIDCISNELRIGTCTNFVYTQPTASDNCSNIRLELISGIGVNGSFPIGITEEVYMVTDASGNTASCMITIINEPEIEVVAEVTDISCAGETDGAVNISVSGTNSPFEISIEGSNTMDELSPGNYNYMVTDFTGCQITVTFDISEPDALAISEAEVSRPTNSNSGDGAINITVEGGTPPFSFTWMTEDEFFSDEEDLTLLFPGEYMVDIQDARGCTISSDAFVLEELTSINDPVLVSKVSTYPNPSTEYLRIDLTDLDFSRAQIELVSAAGQLVKSEKINGSNHVLGLEGLTNGIYVMKLKIDEDFVVRSILKHTGY